MADKFPAAFNQFKEVCQILEAITDVYMNAGFESQRTFNRVFLEEYRLSPRDYRKQNRISVSKNIEEFEFE